MRRATGFLKIAAVAAVAAAGSLALDAPAFARWGGGGFGGGGFHGGGWGGGGFHGGGFHGGWAGGGYRGGWAGGYRGGWAGGYRGGWGGRGYGYGYGGYGAGALIGAGVGYGLGYGLGGWDAGYPAYVNDVVPVADGVPYYDYSYDDGSVPCVYRLRQVYTPYGWRLRPIRYCLP